MLKNLITNKSFQEDIFEQGDMLTFKKGDQITEYQENLKYVFFILSGNLKVSDMDISTGKEQVLHILGKGDIYDIVTILDGKAHDYNIEAINDIKLIRVPMKVIQYWLKEDPQFNMFFLGYISETIRKLEKLSLSLSLDNVNHRIINLILESADKDSNKYKLIDNLNNDDIAAIVGSVRNVIQRERTKIKNEKQIV